MTRRTTSLVVFCLLVTVGVPLMAGEWLTWRGPNYNGVSAENGLVSTWDPGGENLAWKADFIGRSTPVVLDGTAYVIGRVGDGTTLQEVVAAYDAFTGDLRWERRHNVYHTTVPDNRVGWASLVADDETGNIYAHGVAGQLIAFDRNGNTLWEHFLAEEYGRYSGYGGRTQTAVVDGDLLIINFISKSWGELAALRHRYYAFDKRTGEPVWISTPGNMPFDFNTQSVPVVAEIDGERLIVAGNSDGWVYGMRVATGEKVWGFQLSRRGINASVAIHDGVVFISHSEENIDGPTMGRLVAFKAGGEGDITKNELWRIDELSAGFSTPAVHDGRVYVIDNSANMHAVDIKTGAPLWEHSIGTVGKGSAVLADGKMYVTEVNGHFHILKPGKDGVETLDTEKLSVPDGRYAEIYGSPAIAYGRVYFTTEWGLYCLGKTDAPRPKTFSRQRTGAGRAAKGAEVAAIQIVPAVLLTEPGQKTELNLRAVDKDGNLIDQPGTVEWALEGLEGKLKNGRFSPSSGAPSQVGKITATVAGKTAATRVRVLPPLPWNMGFEDGEIGSTPASWINAKGTYVIADLEGEKVLHKMPRKRGLNRTTIFFGSQQLRDYTIEAEILGKPNRRRKPDIGLVNGGYSLDLQGAHQKLQIRSWAAELRMAKEIDFPWELDAWYSMKLSVEIEGGTAFVRGKVWKRGEAEPAEWTITAEDALPILSGSPGLVGYSPADMYYDNIKVTVNK
ncbi:MAG: PQQ-binding-like beta-propeller repeat protein [Acidobacteriota bacterium]|nr:PQQ-binding-like beta-propeller repeat protein [Acidobacteriota bacterium]MDH3786329.1 PQQ-binding-like beta-propeller repeat protein [Acidobacteriota bacterium]